MRKNHTLEEVDKRIASFASEVRAHRENLQRKQQQLEQTRQRFYDSKL